MARIWVLDTETKGTGAEMVPLEKVLTRDASRSERISVARRTVSTSLHHPDRRRPFSATGVVNEAIGHIVTR